MPRPDMLITMKDNGSISDHPDLFDWPFTAFWKILKLSLKQIVPWGTFYNKKYFIIQHFLLYIS